MTNRKKGLAKFDNDQQRTGAASRDPDIEMYEKGTQMERGTAHEFSSELQSEAGSKNPRVSDRPPGQESGE